MSLTISESVSIWDRTLKQLSQNIDKVTLDTFFAESYIHSVSGSEIVVVVTSTLASTVIQSKYAKEIDDIIYELTHFKYIIKYITSAQAKELVDTSKEESSEFFADAKIDPRYTFENFVVGPSNREAYQAAVIAAREPGKFYNPVLIYGDSGLGKTHLLHAIGNSIKSDNPSSKVLYVKAHDFLDEYVKYIKSDRDGIGLVAWFKNSVDVLLVDDVQFLASKTKTEEMFFSIYNYLHSAGKQVVITADRHPSTLNGLDDRLVTRFISGLPVSVTKPEKAVCESILKKLIDEKGMSLSNFDPEVINYFATRFGGSVRELEGAFAKLVFYSQNFTNSKHIDLQIAIESVKGLTSSVSPEESLNEERIISCVADYYSLTPNQITGSSRIANIALARHIAMYLIRTMLDTPFTKMGAKFGGKDHSTVMTAVSKIEEGLKTDEQLKIAVKELKKRLNG
ncbi:MAG: chromosomal replication initiator protein DnaA [Bacilli bacterium]|nr:chromosomal replication initiator protein DnaA [Bacilli bacterium]